MGWENVDQFERLVAADQRDGEDSLRDVACEKCRLEPERVYRIHPAIGIARVGDAPNAFFVGPERPGMYADPANAVNDADLKDLADISTNAQFKEKGLIKRQGARFRIYEYEKKGAEYKLTREINAENADIEWFVDLANTKAVFYKFDGPHWRGKRKGPTVEPGPKSIKGTPKGGGVSIAGLMHLGDLRTDAKGRLIVLGGKGAAKHESDPNDVIGDYANNDGWVDDVSDGPISATITLHGESKPIEKKQILSAWVLVGPPDFAPGVRNVVTLYDMLFHVASTARRLKYKRGQRDAIVHEWHRTDQKWRGLPPVFSRDIAPFFSNVSDSQWVLEAAYPAGQKHPKIEKLRQNLQLDDAQLQALQEKFRRQAVRKIKSALERGGKIGKPAKLERVMDRKLDSLEDAARGDDVEDIKKVRESFEFRFPIFESIRPPVSPYPEAGGRAPRGRMLIGVAPPEKWKRIAHFRHTMPTLWGDEGSSSYLTVTPTQYRALRRWAIGLITDDQSFDEIYSGDISPAGLDRAALDNASGGAFFPGIEAGWLIRQAVVFQEPFRIKEAGRSVTIKGHTMKIRAGFFSQQMAQPWHADFLDCAGSGKEAWWPAQRPIEVFPEASNAQSSRRGWASAIGLYNDMVEKWSQLGFVVNVGSAANEFFTETETT